MFPLRTRARNRRRPRQRRLRLPDRGRALRARRRPARAVQPRPSSPWCSTRSERDVVVENPEVEAVFTTRGAVLKHWRLKRYLGADGKPLDLVPSGVPDGNCRTVRAVGRGSADRSNALPGPVQTERGPRGRLVTPRSWSSNTAMRRVSRSARSSVSTPSTVRCRVHGRGERERQVV